MGDILETIKSRRSIRRYTDEPVPDELIIRILEAGRWAPTAEDHQAWRMIVVTGENKDKLEKMARRRTQFARSTRDTAALVRSLLDNSVDTARQERAMAAMTRFWSTGDNMTMGFKAPVIIVVLGKLDAAAWEDTPACIQNMLLEAHSLGLGCCWYPVGGERRSLEWKKLLKIPEGMGEYAIIAWFAVGWPAESPRPRPRKKLEEIVSWEEFGNTRKLPEVPLTVKYELPRK